MQLARCIAVLKRKCVFVAANAADLTAISGTYDHILKTRRAAARRWTIRARRHRRCRRASQALDVSDQAPNIFICDLSKRRHLSAAHAFANRLEDFPIRVAVCETRARERGTAVAPAVRPMARLTRLVEQSLPGCNGRRIVCERIARGVWLLRECRDSSDFRSGDGGEPLCAQPPRR